MIQDIGEERFHNEYENCSPKGTDRILCYRKREFLAGSRDGSLVFLTFQELETYKPQLKETGAYRYLFRIDEVRYFLILEEGLREEVEEGCFPGMSWHPIESLRSAGGRTEAFACITGFQLAGWYASRRFCPKCGSPMVHDARERMVHCLNCGQMEYPKISPAVIVAVTKGDQLLLTKYAGRAFTKYALIAGFTEIGETVEETVQREVMEEVGLRVKNIRYYKSQPWSFTSTLLMGFFAEADGEDEIRMDETELSEAVWCPREEVPEDDGVSLTREMMRIFKEDRMP